MKTSTFALLAGAGLFAATTALANHHEGKGEMDKDHMKMGEMAEMHFAEMDADSDGAVTEAEFLEFKMAKAKAMFAEAAGDDGVMTLDEMKAHHHARMEEHKAGMKTHHESGDDHEDNDDDN